MNGGTQGELLRLNNGHPRPTNIAEAYKNCTVTGHQSVVQIRNHIILTYEHFVCSYVKIMTKFDLDRPYWPSSAKYFLKVTFLNFGDSPGVSPQYFI